MDRTVKSTLCDSRYSYGSETIGTKLKNRLSEVSNFADANKYLNFT